MNKISRKILSFGITLCILLSVFSGVVFAKNTETIVILYENDVHCAVEGYSKLAAMKNELSEDYEYVGVVSSGDFVQGGTLGAGLINGKSESTLKPKDNATRTEVAAILYRFIASELMELGS